MATASYNFFRLECESPVFIDDFGTGYSSLSLLRELPISGLKIDRAFVQELEQNQSDANLVKSLLFLAENMQLESISEGIESLDQLEFIKYFSHGKSHAQGFYLSRPLSAQAMEDLLREKNKVQTTR